MTTIHVQFADETEEAIVSCFLSAQDSEYWDFLGEVDARDPRWHDYYSQMPEAAKAHWPAPEEEPAKG